MQLCIIVGCREMLGKTPKTEEQILQAVIWDIMCRISWKGRFCKSDSNFVLCEYWGIGVDILH